jgi:hypothetical protein
MLAMGAAFAIIGPTAVPKTASANTPSTWSGVADGVQFGWTSDHAWAIASYATVARYGAGEVASLACDAVSGGSGPICDYLAEEVVAELAAGHPRLTNHGLWIAVYPLANYRIAAGAY